MKYEPINTEEILDGLNELCFISQFIMYEKFGYDKKRLRKKLKKLIRHVEKGHVKKYMDNDYLKS